MEKKLHLQHKRVIEHKKYIMNAINYKMIFVAALIVPLVVWSWKGSNRKWPALVTAQIVQIGTAAVLAYFQKQLMVLFNK